jgi:hypothetical protein
MASLGATASSPLPKAPKVVSWLGIIGSRLISSTRVAARIASYIARGEILVDWRDAIGRALCGPGRTRRVVT